jgi:hypothetical protein
MEPAAGANHACPLRLRRCVAVRQAHLVKTVRWLHDHPQQSHPTLDGVVKLLSGAEDTVARQWRELPVSGCVGRYVPGSSSDANIDSPRPTGDYETWLRMHVSSVAETEVNVQLGQLTLNQHQMTLLERSVSDQPDFVAIFGATLDRHQCGEVSRTEHRQWFRLLAVDHDVQIWDADERSPPPPPKGSEGGALTGWAREVGPVP